MIILTTLFCWLVNPAFAQQDKNEEINRIKRDLSYLTATGTSTVSEKEAYENAKVLMNNEIEQWLSENANGDITGYIAKSKENMSFIDTQMGRLYRSFVYVKKTDILPYYKDEIVIAESTKPVVPDTVTIAVDTTLVKKDVEPLLVVTDTLFVQETVSICDTTAVCDSLIVNENPVVEAAEIIVKEEVQAVESDYKEEQQQTEEVTIVEETSSVVEVKEAPAVTSNGIMLDEREEKEMLKNYSLSSVSKYLGKLKRAEKLADYGVKNKWEDNGIVYIFFADYNDVVRGYLRVSNGQAVNLANGNQVEVVDYISKYETGTYIWFTLK